MRVVAVLLSLTSAVSGRELSAIERPWNQILSNEEMVRARIMQEESMKTEYPYRSPGVQWSKEAMAKRGCKYAVELDGAGYDHMQHSLERLHNSGISAEEFNQRAPKAAQDALSELELEVEDLTPYHEDYANTSSAVMALERKAGFNQWMKGVFDAFVGVPDIFSKNVDMCIQISWMMFPGLAVGVVLHGGVTFDALGAIDNDNPAKPDYDISDPAKGSWTLTAGLALSLSISAAKVLGIHVLLEGDFELSYTQCDGPFHAFKSFFNSLAGDQLTSNKDIQKNLEKAAREVKSASDKLLRKDTNKLNKDYIKYLAAPMTMALSIKANKQIQTDICSLNKAGELTFAAESPAEVEKMARSLEKISLLLNYWTLYYVLGGKDAKETAPKAAKTFFHQMKPMPYSDLKTQLWTFLKDSMTGGDKTQPLPDACDKLADEWQYYSRIKNMVPDAMKYMAFHKAATKATNNPKFKFTKDTWDGAKTWLKDESKKGNWGVDPKPEGYNYPKTVCQLLKRWVGGVFSGGREYDMAIYPELKNVMEVRDNHKVLCDSGLCYDATSISFFKGAPAGATKAKPDYAIILWKPTANLYGHLFDNIMYAASLLSKYQYSKDKNLFKAGDSAKSYAALVSAMETVKDASVFLENAAEKALLFNPAVDETVIDATLDAADEKAVANLATVQMNTPQNGKEDADAGNDFAKGSDYHDDDRGSPTVAKDLMENNAHIIAAGNYVPLKDGATGVFAAMCTASVRSSSFSDFQQGLQQDGQIEQTWHKIPYSGEWDTFEGVKGDMEREPQHLWDDYGMTDLERQDLRADLERMELEREVTFKAPSDPSKPGNDPKDEASTCFSPTKKPTSSVGVGGMDLQISEARAAVSIDKETTDIGLWSLDAGDGFISIWAQAGNLHKDLGKSMAAIDQGMRDNAAVKSEAECQQQCSVSVKSSFTATFSFQFPTWDDLKADKAWGAMEKNTYDVCSPDTNPIQVHHGYTVETQISPTWWTGGDEAGQQWGLCLNAEEKTHKKSVSLEGYVPPPAKDAWPAGDGAQLSFIKPKVEFSWGHMHCTSLKGCRKSEDHLTTKKPSSNAAVTYVHTDARDYTKALDVSLDFWFSPPAGKSSIINVVALINTWGTLICRAVETFILAKIETDASTGGLKLSGPTSNKKKYFTTFMKSWGQAAWSKTKMTGAAVKTLGAIAASKLQATGHAATEALKKRIGIGSSGFNILTIGLELEWTNTAAGCTQQGLMCDARQPTAFEISPRLEFQALDQMTIGGPGTIFDTLMKVATAGVSFKFTGQRAVSITLDSDTCTKLQGFFQGMLKKWEKDKILSDVIKDLILMGPVTLGLCALFGNEGLIKTLVKKYWAKPEDKATLTQADVDSIQTTFDSKKKSADFSSASDFQQLYVPDDATNTDSSYEAPTEVPAEETPFVEASADSGDWKSELKREIMSEILPAVKDALHSAMHPGNDHEIDKPQDAAGDQDQDLSTSDMEIHPQSLGLILDDANALEKEFE